MKKILISIISFIFSVGVLFAQKPTAEVAVDPTAKSILDKASAKFNTHSGLSANLDITVINNQNNKKQTIKGALLIKGSKFKLTLPEVCTYYDGKTEYVHLLKEKEVNVSEPKEEDLKETNPLFLLQAYKSDYKMRYEGAGKENGKTTDIVNLFPNDRNKPFSIITLSIDKNTLLPVSIKSKGKNGVDTVVNIHDIADKKIEDTEFVFDEKANKGVEIIDLR